MLSLIKRYRPSNAMLLGFIAILAGFNQYTNQPKISLSPIVEVSTGKLQGIVSKSREGKEFFEFRGIPYAKPPIGDLRFEVPQPPLPWNGILQANKFQPDCIQVNPVFQTVSGSEDCLFLNVYAPKIANGFSETGLPVLVYYHGGFFMYGSATNHPPTYFLDEYVILVSVNARLGALGFLNTGDGIVRGNMGLKDQTMALRWVQANIKKFGGDPGNVIIQGESAGSTAVNYHMLSKMSKGTFQKAICQSGTALRIWATQAEPKKQALRLASILNCTRATSAENVKCLKGLKAETIVETHREANTPILNGMFMYAPTIETFEVDKPDTFITEDPRKLLVEGKAHRVPWMLGINSGEGLLYTGRMINKPDYKSQFDTNFTEVFPTFFVYDKNRKDVTQKLRKFYLGVDSDKDYVDLEEKFINYTNMITDRLHSSPVRFGATHHSKHSPVYLYYNDYSTEFTLYDFLTLEGKYPPLVEIFAKLLSNWFQKLRGVAPFRLGGSQVTHGDELSLMFPFPMAEVTHSSPDFEMSRNLIKLWVQFAYDHTKMEHNGVHWTPVSSTSHKYMQFSNDPQGNKLIDEPFRERADFWDSLNLPN